MICKSCRREVDKHDVFCRWCGNRLIKDSTEIPVPAPTRKADGSYTHQIMKDGKRAYITGSTLDEYKTRVRLFKQGLYYPPGFQEREYQTITQLAEDYIRANEHVLSPSTIRGYNYMLERIADYGEVDVMLINWQEYVNKLSVKYKPKTVKNTWAFISRVLHYSHIPVPDVNLPAVPKSDRPFLTPEEIVVFCDAIRGESIELASLLALHSLRLSEIVALQASDIYDSTIHIRRSAVRNSDSQIVVKNTNKTTASSRDIPIFIPRIVELLPSNGSVIDIPLNSVSDKIRRASIKANVTAITCHDLRRSFSSLCYSLGISERACMAMGGWDDLDTVHHVYIKLGDKTLLDAATKLRDYFKFTQKG